MKINDKTNYAYRPKPIETSVSRMYCLLTDENIITDRKPLDEKKISTIISWLPNIAEIEVTLTFGNDYIDITFINGEEIRLYNAGIEYAISRLIAGEQ